MFIRIEKHGSVRPAGAEEGRKLDERFSCQYDIRAANGQCISDKIYEAGEANTNEANTNNSVLNKMKAGGGENVRK